MGSGTAILSPTAADLVKREPSGSRRRTRWAGSSKGANRKPHLALDGPGSQRTRQAPFALDLMDDESEYFHFAYKSLALTDYVKGILDPHDHILRIFRRHAQTTINARGHPDALLFESRRVGQSVKTFGHPNGEHPGCKE